MTAVAWAGGRNLAADTRERWRRTPPRTKTSARVAALLGMVVVAYHYSLSSLLQSLSLETPLAYVGLTPVIALGIAALRARPIRPEPAIHDRQLDYILGVPLLAVAVAVNLIFPTRLSTMFWVWRIDLFTLPFFVAGAVAVLFGVRTMWRQRLAIGFLFLAWPLPYQVLLLRYLTSFTDATLVALKALLHVVPVAETIPSADGSLFQVVHGKPFQISVVSACSGVNGMVGFLLVGVAFGAVVRGPRILKGLWLLGGLTLLWMINVLRILFIFWVGKRWGEGVAIDVFHPFVGLVTFNLGVLAMLLLLKPFRLSIDGTTPRRPAAAAGDSERRPAVPRIGIPILLVVFLGGTLALTNSRLGSYDLVANAVGTPKLASFSDHPATPDGWGAAKSDQYEWAKPYFGDSSSWLRYTLTPGTSPDLALASNRSITADVISTSNLRSFSAYGVEACYRFHGYKLRDVASINLGGGVTGQTLSFYNAKQQQDWTVAYWIWPVKRGDATRYERVTLYIQDSGTSTFAAAEPDGVRSLRGGLSGRDPVARKLSTVRSFLVEFSRQVVQNQAKIVPGSSLPVNRTVVPPVPEQLLRLKEARQAAAQAGGARPAGQAAPVQAASADGAVENP